MLDMFNSYIIELNVLGTFVAFEKHSVDRLSVKNICRFLVDLVRSPHDREATALEKVAIDFIPDLSGEGQQDKSQHG